VPEEKLDWSLFEMIQTKAFSRAGCRVNLEDTGGICTTDSIEAAPELN
jgi:hypothetical protein